ncbi:MAG: NUDIX domain-containing protein [Paracoccus sp. (in: a-proteobacteria)]|nr:NUDIX domain-containing protein [Paracoccus sp. (in: a-proteobacteria)]
MIRRFGPPPRRATGYRYRPGAYAVLWRAGHVLVTHQAAPSPEIQLPGGGVDPGEHPLHALHREVREETGWSLADARFLGHYRRFCTMPKYGIEAEKICSVWLARPVMRLGPPSERDHSAHWLSAAAALAHLPDPGSREMLHRALRLIHAG